MSNFCEKVGADIESVRLGIGADRRIGYSFIYPGIGFGGSCFPKDVKAIIHTGYNYGYEMKLLKAVEEVNIIQKSKLFEKIKDHFDKEHGSLKGKTIGIWGLSFKPETDDMREAPSQVIIKGLIEEGAKVHAHDQKAVDEAKKIFGDYEDKITYFNDNYECLKGCDAMALLTEWHIYRQPDFEKIKSLLRIPLIFDGRNQYDPEDMKRYGIKYFCIGRK
jgi:UDPglucose 6-dehydrogenase